MQRIEGRPRRQAEGAPQSARTTNHRTTGHGHPHVFGLSEYLAFAFFALCMAVLMLLGCGAMWVLS